MVRETLMDLIAKHSGTVEDDLPRSLIDQAKQANHSHINSPSKRQRSSAAAIDPNKVVLIGHATGFRRIKNLMALTLSK